MKPYYERAGIVLFHADCRDVLPTLERESCDLLLTDPPYGVDWQSGRRSVPIDRMVGDDDASWVPAALSTAGLALRRRRHAYVFGAFPIEEFPLRHAADLIWDKMLLGSGDLTSCWAPSHEPIMFCIRAPDRAKANMEGGKVPARLRGGSILSYKRPNANGVKFHPTQKPVALLRRLIESSTFPGERVLDPFVGCGSSMVAAVAEGRVITACEIDEGYCEVAAKRADRAIDAMDQLADAFR